MMTKSLRTTAKLFAAFFLAMMLAGTSELAAQVVGEEVLFQGQLRDCDEALLEFGEQLPFLPFEDFDDPLDQAQTNGQFSLTFDDEEDPDAFQLQSSLFSQVLDDLDEEIDEDEFQDATYQVQCFVLGDERLEAALAVSFSLNFFDQPELTVFQSTLDNCDVEAGEFEDLDIFDGNIDDPLDQVQTNGLVTLEIDDDREILRAGLFLSLVSVEELAEDLMEGKIDGLGLECFDPIDPSLPRVLRAVILAIGPLEALD